MWGDRFSQCNISNGALIFNIHILNIFNFNMDAGLQVDIDFSTECECSCSSSRFFSPLSGHSKPINYPFGLSGPPNHPVSKARPLCVNVNKHGSY